MKTKNITRYSSKSGKRSGVTAYHLSADHIIVEFNYKKRYRYSYTSAGKAAVEKMKKLAKLQQGLGTYISQHKPPYESTWEAVH